MNPCVIVEVLTLLLVLVSNGATAALSINCGCVVDGSNAMAAF